MNNKTQTFRSNGKLLLTSEYVVLDGAKALAIPTKFGQRLTIKPHNSNAIVWKSYNELDELWFEDRFLITNSSAGYSITTNSYNPISERLIQIFTAAKTLNPLFLNSDQGYIIDTQQDFNRLWGLGTSSTLINNIANWAEVDAYKLLELTFGGSGYDIACAQHDTPIIYRLNPPMSPIVETVNFNPNFKNQLYFVYLNQKQNSRNGISNYKQSAKINANIIKDLNRITESILTCETLSEFRKLIDAHEIIISKLIYETPIKSRLFEDFNGSIKSLGAWGGDFVIAASETNPTEYFISKGFDIIIPYKDMIL